MDRHRQDVAAIAAKVRDFHDRNEAFRIYHGSTNSTRTLQFRKDRVVDVSHLDHILTIDRSEQLAWVEPNVSMEKLVKATLPVGLVPKVVMEFPGITVGGGFAGPSGESSSFKYGFFEDIVESIEVVLGNGDIVTASETKLPDLLEASCGSLGTFGITTLLHIQLMEAKEFVQLDCYPVFNVPEAVEKIKAAVADDTNDYVDGILFALDHGVIMVGHLTDKASLGVQLQTFSRARDPWFYIFVERLFNRKKLASQHRSVVVPLRDYLFRYDRGAFWTGRFAYQYFLTPFNRITRWALDAFMHTRVLYQALHASGLADRLILQDLAVPQGSTKDLIEYLDQEVGIYPLWLCPLRQGPGMSLVPNHCRLHDQSEEAKVLNVGLWGPGPKDRDAFFAMNRKIEHKLHGLGGLKWLYARVYYTEDEFWQIYDRKTYDARRLRYHASSIPTVYDKIKINQCPNKETAGVPSHLRTVWNVWPIRGLYGVYCAILGLYVPSRKNYILTE